MPLLESEPVDLELGADGDLVVDSDVHFTRGLPAIVQGIRIRTLMFRGEWFLNLDEGVPYFQDILGRRFNPTVARAAFRPALRLAPGVKQVESLDAVFNGATRELGVSWRVSTEFGDTADEITLTV